MARPYPPTTRATDADRATVLGLLDAAYTDGQLDGDEHDLRADLLGEARTLGDLDALVDDLQLSSPPPRPMTSGSAQPLGRRVFAVGTAIVAVAAAVAAIVHFDRDDTATPEATAAVATDLDALPPRVIPTPDLRTEEGIAQFVADYRTKFGDTVADEIGLYGMHAGVDRALPREPNRLVEYDYWYGFELSRAPTTRDVNTPTIDLAALDVPAIGRVLTEAPALLNVPGGTVSHVYIGSYDGEPFVRVYVDNEFDESGYLSSTFTGEIDDVYPFGR